MYIHQQQASQKEVIQAQVTASKPNSSNHWTRVFPAPNQPHSSEAQLVITPESPGSPRGSDPTHDQSA
ncbi:hypothetical protein COP2_008975 [Malus domestica]